MYKWGKQSKANLEGVHPLLVSCADEALRVMDLSVICGKRTTAEQQALYAIGRTTELNRKPVTTIDGIKKKSKHQVQQDGWVHAIDVAPYPIIWDAKIKARGRFYMMWGVFLAVSQPLLQGTGYKLRWGGDWDGDNSFTDQNFDDLPHIELIEDK